MAEKEANVFIVDVGKSMNQRRQGRQQTDLEWAMSYVWDRITSAVATERKTLLQGVVALKSDTTQNDLGENDEAYSNIEVVQDLAQILLPQLNHIRNALQPSSTDTGDALSALVVAITMIEKTCRHLKYKKKITLVTNGLGNFDNSELDEIATKIKGDGIDVVILGIDFDDADFGFKEEDKPFIKHNNEEALKAFAETCGGGFGTLAEAIQELGEPRVKETKPVPSYKGTLTLGDSREHANTALVINVERYPRTMIRRPQTATSFVVKADESKDGAAAESTDVIMGGTNDPPEDSNDLVGIRNEIKYHLAEKDEKGNNLTVERDELARGYEYGRTAVHITESDEGITKLETSAGFEIIGFIPWTNFERYMTMSTTHVVVAQRSDSKAIMALSSFIHALHELESFAVARLVSKDGKQAAIELLAPSIEPDYECLINVQLPFAEDVRQYKFAPLDKVVTVSGKVLKEHRYLPSEKLQSAMDAYVEAMDLSTLATDENGNETEYATFNETFSPVLHRIDQAVRFRAIHPKEPIPPPSEILTRYSNPPEDLQQVTKRILDNLIETADVKKVPPKSAGRRKREAVKPLSGLDIDALLGGTRNNAVRLDPNNSVPSFKRALENPSHADALQEVAQQMGAIIEKRIKDSFGDSTYEQALEEIKVLREELIDLEAGDLWNSFIKSLKQKLLGNQLGDGREEMWWRIRKMRLGLHEGTIYGHGQVTADDAREFLASKSIAVR